MEADTPQATPPVTPSPTPAPVRRSRFRKFLLVCGVIIIVGIVGIFIGLSFIPGGVSHVKLSYRVPPFPMPAMTPPPTTTATTAPAPATPTAPVAKSLYLTYTLPTDLLQREVAALFPVTEGVEGMMKIVLSNPRFVPDSDPGFLRLTVDLRAVMAGTKTEEYPGVAVVRTQLRFDSGASTVALRNAQLAEFRFTGAAASVAESLRPVIESELADQMNGYVVFKLPKKPEWWMKNGISFVRDVVVENGQVVVVIGT